MKTPSFWYRPPGAAARLLAPLGALYGFMTARRMACPGERPPLPVLCVGNFVAGGAGKTPTVIALAAVAGRAGLSVCCVTRGYGGSLEGPVMVDLDHHTAALVGDEALLLARAAPTVVCRDRQAAMALAAQSRFDLAIMDDGFQNPSITKSLSLVVVDGAVGVGNGHCLPAGPLRAPLALQLPLTDAVVVLGEPAGALGVIRAAARAGRAILRASLEQQGIEAFRGRRVYAFAGIGRPEKFFDQLITAGIEVVEARGFPDHHAYTGVEAREILVRADDLGALPVTTEKDAVRIAHAAAGPQAELASRCVAVSVDCTFDAPDLVRGMIETALERWRTAG